jgi:hypothetical protein
LREHGSRVSAATRERIQRAADALKEKLKAQAPIAEIRQLMKELEEVSLELGRELYQASGTSAPGSSERASDGKDYIDADTRRKTTSKLWPSETTMRSWECRARPPRTRSKKPFGS